MKRTTPFLLTITLVSLVALAAAWSDEPASEAATDVPADAALQVDPPTNVGDEWGVQFSPVPELLRMHLPMLRGHAGMLVDGVQPQSPAHALGLQRGDVLIRVNGRMVSASSQLPPGGKVTEMHLVRRGRVMLLPRRWHHAGPRPHSMPPAQMSPLGVQAQPFVQPPVLDPLLSPPNVGGASASAYASGNESVSVSQVGDQIVIEMQSPATGQLRIKGTRDQILQELQHSDLAPAAKRKVLRALR